MIRFEQQQLGEQLRERKLWPDDDVMPPRSARYGTFFRLVPPDGLPVYPDFTPPDVVHVGFWTRYSTPFNVMSRLLVGRAFNDAGFAIYPEGLNPDDMDLDEHETYLRRCGISEEVDAAALVVTQQGRRSLERTNTKVGVCSKNLRQAFDRTSPAEGCPFWIANTLLVEGREDIARLVTERFVAVPAHVDSDFPRSIIEA